MGGMVSPAPCFKGDIMAVILFKDGRPEKFDEYSFTDRLKEGWSLDNAPAVEKAEETPVSDDFDNMTKKELEKYARTFTGKDGKPIELDRRMNKNNMIKAFNEQKG
jgi:hypothetical protein